MPYQTLSAMTSRRERKLTLSPREYIDRVRFGGDHQSKTDQLIRVEGDLILKGLQTLGILPEAQIKGNVLIQHCHGITGFTFSCEGSVLLEDCSKFTQAKGLVGTMAIKRCGIESLGADLECGGDCLIEDCYLFSRINCRVVGRLSLSGRGMVYSGPAFSCEGGVHLRDGAGLTSWHKDRAAVNPSLI